MTSVTPATQTVTPVDAGWRRLSVRMLAVHPVLELGRALPAVVALLVVGSQRGQGGWWSLIGLAAAVTLGLLRWATTRYRITENQVEIQRGLLNRRVLTVPRDRVRTVDVTSHVLHRVLGLARVAVGTGQSDRRRQDGLVLDGLTTADAARLRDDLLHSRPGGAPVPAPREPDAPAGSPALASATSREAASSREAATSREAASSREEVLAALAPGWIRYGPFTLSGLVTIGIVVAFAWRTVNEANLNPERLAAAKAVGHQLARLPVVFAVAEVVLAGLVLVAAASTVAYTLAFWNFRLTRSASATLHVTRGLLTTRATTIEERRLRGLELSEPLLLRAVRGARCVAITTGLRVGRGAERGGSLILPPAPATEAYRVGAAVLGDPVPLTMDLTRHPRAALRRRLVRVAVSVGLLTAAAGLLSWVRDDPSWVITTAVVLGPAGLLVGIDRYRSLGHAISGRWLVFRQGCVVRRRCVLAVEGVIGVTIRQSVFQRRSNLVTLTATTAAGRQRYELPDVGAARGVAIADAVLPGVLAPLLAPVTPAG